MQPPVGYTEEQVLCVINSVVAKLAAPFRFGFHDTDDMKQEGRIFALEALRDNKFDAERGTLQVFLTNHIRNRFINMQRDKFERKQPPCSSCPFAKGKDGCGAFACRDDCDKWAGWRKRNTVKRNLMESYNPNDVIEHSGDDCDTNSILSNLSDNEMFQYVNKNIPVPLRADFRRLLDGVKLPRARTERLIQTVKSILAQRFGEDD